MIETANDVVPIETGHSERDPVNSANPKSTIDIEKYIARSPLLCDLPHPSIARLARSTHQIRAGRGNMVFQKGTACIGLYIIVTGQLKLAFPSRRGIERVFTILGQGQTFDEASLLLDKPYAASAYTLVDSVLLHIARDTLIQELEKSHNLCRKMLYAMATHERQLMTIIESCSIPSARQRLIDYLIHEPPAEAVQGFDVSINLPSAKSTIASLLNLTPETFSRTLHDWTVPFSRHPFSRARRMCWW
jgi:CRP-like cAMP-binding protein